MAATLIPPKITPAHLDRQALIYVRQSTLLQVREHTGSAARQYDLVQRARYLGWSPEQIHVIDQDQGLSGASAAHRDGFQFLVAQVGLGHAGAVLCLEASRLARSCSDWYRLLEICALSQTLVIDEEGVYDPGEFNDRLLLGFKGTMSEAELHWLRQRLLGGKWEKARQGALRLPLPTGFAYDPAGQIVLDPDEQVQQAIRLALEMFDQLGGALAVVRYFAEHQLLFPTRRSERAHRGELVWRPLRLSRLLNLLHNPVYAGAYVFGRPLSPSKRRHGSGRALAPARGEKELILLRDVHPGYLSWEQYQRNEERLADNRSHPSPERRGAVREGSALLQGLLLCGRCGRRMTVGYRRDGTTPIYNCSQAHSQWGVPICQSILGRGVDAAVAAVFLEAMQPAQLEISLATLTELEARARQVERQWELRLERARYDADLARRRFVAVDPENRLVARTLEREWNEKLAAVARLEQEAVTRPSLAARLASPEERQRILALAQDLPAVWRAATTRNTERKQLLRFLIRDVTLTRREETLHVGIRWQTGAVTERELPRPQFPWETRRTEAAVLERIRTLARQQTDREIAGILNEEGLTSGWGRPFTGALVWGIRHRAQIATACPEAPGACTGQSRGDGRVSVGQAAAQLNVHVSTIIAWCQSGRLDGVQAVAHGPWWVRLTPEEIERLRKPEREYYVRRASKEVMEARAERSDPKAVR